MLLCFWKCLTNTSDGQAVKITRSCNANRWYFFYHQKTFLCHYSSVYMWVVLFVCFSFTCFTVHLVFNDDQRTLYPSNNQITLYWLHARSFCFSSKPCFLCSSWFVSGSWRVRKKLFWFCLKSWTPVSRRGISMNWWPTSSVSDTRDSRRSTESSL